ncbi:hypothetical protein ACJ73_09410 [Blastomyces percursus]|uniref:Uncharacterized protein n=1 Tax=Blastomyces percursus TaxID=1658174 RepID=A0A1J9QA91_9EURO|nr:hypothetical protein ACJ73_09410 [Blastomyces percursus]
MTRDASEFTSDAGAGSPSDTPVQLPPNPSSSSDIDVFTSTLQNLKASGVGQEEAFKFAMARWRAVFDAQNAQTVPTANPSMPVPASTSAFRDFKDDFGHVDMKMNNKLAGTTNYDVWRREVLAKAALIRASDILKNHEEEPHPSLSPDEGRIWRWKEAKLWECMWNNLKNDPQTLVQSKLEQIDQDGSTRMGNASALWDALELEYQVQ